ncbi:MAG TPA: hypothetical protein VNX15_03570 [Gemmatimonadales bacterium]|nr:hypothetical protein [Gemmatimonadales bacterium]
MVDVVAALDARYPGAEITESVKPADWTGEEVHWVRVDQGDHRTIFVGVTKEALDHPQNLIRQLDEYLLLLAPNSSATVTLRDHSDLRRFAL